MPLSSPRIGLLFSLVFALIAEAGEAPKPNIVLVIADQWRQQAFGFAGDPNVKTPHFDRLAGESVRFTNAVSGMPVCSPTRASLLTGQRPLTHGVFLNDVPLDPAAATLPKALKAAGYDTACIGKWHVDGHGRTSFIPPERRQGFDYWKVCECTHNYTDSIYYGDTSDKLRRARPDARRLRLPSLARERNEAVSALARVGSAARSLSHRAGAIPRHVRSGTAHLAPEYSRGHAGENADQSRRLLRPLRGAR
jgi:arylsulfatase A-like enzyme